MKKVIIYIFLLLANVALLAHTIIPHHHCNTAVVCVTDTHCCEDADEEHDHQHDTNKHSHEGTGPNDCIVDGTYILQSSQLSNSSDNFNVQLPILFCLCHTNPIVDITQLDTLPFQPVSYLISYHSAFITHSLGLRAPPAC